jgi:SAM-dependent methyltransferase
MADWDEHISCRDQIYERYPRIWDLKLIRKPSALLRSYLHSRLRILDIGINGKTMTGKLETIYSDLIYKRIDVDPGFLSDMHLFDDTQKQFDFIILFEVIEQLQPEQGMELLNRLNKLLVDGGKLIISTPNIFNPSRVWKDADFRTAYSYEELGGIILSQGFTVLGVYRAFHASVLDYLLHRTLFYPMHRILNVDFAKSIVILAVKKHGRHKIK